MHLRLSIFIFATSLLCGMVALASNAYHHLTKDRIEYTYLSEALAAAKPTVPAINWQPATIELDRPFTIIDETIVGRALTESWTAFHSAQDTGNLELFPDYFQGQGLERVTIAAKSAREYDSYFVNLDITATPIFYHLDGSVLQLRSKSLGIRFLEGEGGTEIYRATHDETLTTMIKEPAGWRFVTHERLAARAVTEQYADAAWLPNLAGVNYYPALSPWTKFWPEFDPFIVEEDFKKIRGLGANAVRVFLPVEVFGQEKVEPDIQHLRALLDLAARHDLRVIPTLFDLRGGYDLASWSRDVRYLRNVLPIIDPHEAVVFVDIKNEPDLDFEVHGRARVEAWLQTMILVINENAQNLRLTIGWSHAQFAPILSHQLHLISYHDYAPIEETWARFQAVKPELGDKPILITEIGDTSWSGVLGAPSSPEKQAARIKKRTEQLLDANGIFIWTLHDFPEPDTAAIGNIPWIKSVQSQFGMLDFEGNEKPAAQTIRTLFAQYLEED